MTLRSSAIAAAEERLRPCGAKTGTAELTACLVLVAPTGMGRAERDSWLKVARDTLRGIPRDLLEYGCRKAREQADHPSKIIPIIMREVGPMWEGRQKALSNLRFEEAPRLAPPGPVAVPREVTQRILREAGIGFDPETAA